MTFVFLFLNFEYHISSKKEKKKSQMSSIFLSANNEAELVNTPFFSGLWLIFQIVVKNT